MDVPKWIVEFAEKASNKWKTRLLTQANKKNFKTEKVKIELGIFQGDSLRPLLFCICIIPVTMKENEIRVHVWASKKENATENYYHLLFMVDMKFYATLPPTTMLNRTTNMLCNIGLELGKEKCAIERKRDKKFEESDQVLLNAGVIIDYLRAGAKYPYLGFISYRAQTN